MQHFWMTIWNLCIYGTHFQYLPLFRFERPEYNLHIINYAYVEISMYRSNWGSSFELDKVKRFMCEYVFMYLLIRCTVQCLRLITSELRSEPVLRPIVWVSINSLEYIQLMFWYIYYGQISLTARFCCISHLCWKTNRQLFTQRVSGKKLFTNSLSFLFHLQLHLNSWM